MNTKKTYCGFVAIIGRSNVGKSTLLNKIIKQKVSITSCKVQTTRHHIIGVHTENEYQAIYVDTPGLYMKKQHVINQSVNEILGSYATGLVIFVIEATRWTSDDEIILNKLFERKASVILAVNKIDIVKKKFNYFLN